MSTLTKICVILLLVLVLVAAPVFIQKAVTDVNWKAYGEKQNTRANLAETNARNYMLAAQSWQRHYEEAMRRAELTAQNFEQTIASKSSEIGRLARELAEANAGQNELRAQLAALQSTMDAQVKHNTALTAQLDEQRKRNIQISDQLRRSEDQIKEYLVSLEKAKERAELLEEQLRAREGEIKEYADKIKELEDEIARLKQGGAAGAEVAGMAAPSGDQIEGEVLAVKVDLASLNVGAASGVKKGMVFKIYRGPNFVAHLRIADVQASTCAGMIFNRVREVQKGDKAATRLE